MQNHPNIITFNDWNYLKQYGKITKGYNNFSEDELDQSVVFYDENMNFLDYLERKEIECIVPSAVLLPKRFWKITNDLPDAFAPYIEIPKRREKLDKISNAYIDDSSGYLRLNIGRHSRIEPADVEIEVPQEHRDAHTRTPFRQVNVDYSIFPRPVIKGERKPTRSRRKRR